MALIKIDICARSKVDIENHYLCFFQCSNRREVGTKEFSFSFTEALKFDDNDHSITTLLPPVANGWNNFSLLLIILTKTDILIK